MRSVHSIKIKKVGSIADFTTFSFHPVKTVTAGEGGAIATNDEKLYHRLLRLRSHGITRNPDEMVHPTDAKWYNEQVELGYNYRMTDFQAALLLSQLDKLDRFIERRTQIVKRYNEAFAECPELVLQQEIPESKTARHLYMIQLNPELLTCTRREFLMRCMRKMCMHRYIICRFIGIPITKSWAIRRDYARMQSICMSM